MITGTNDKLLRAMGAAKAQSDWAMWRLQHNPTNKYCAEQFIEWAETQHNELYRHWRFAYGYAHGYYDYVYSLRHKA